MKTFHAHFNRVNMQRGNPNIWTVHTTKACFQGQRIVIRVPIETVYRPQGQQPRAYFKGRGKVHMEGSTIFVERH